jgi:glycosyltransferase involved in cell wall biosynthesis
MQNEISEYMLIPLNNIALIPNGINIDNFISTDHKINKKGMILVSGNDPQKNLDNFLQSIHILPRSIKQQIKEIDIIGVKGTSFIISSEMEDLKVNFLGYLNHSDVIKYLSKSKYFVLPSLYESFGIPGLEALLSGCKIAASDTGALKEVLGEFAVYFNPYDIDSISNGISKMVTLENYRDSTVFNHLSNYSWDIISNKFINYLNSN